jgi:hypothetical protein
MTDDPVTFGPADPRRIDVDSSAEALSSARELGVTADELRDAVRKVGTDLHAVWVELDVQIARRPKATSRIKRRRDGDARRGLGE